MLRREFLLGEEKRKSLFSKKEAVAKNWDEGAFVIEIEDFSILITVQGEMNLNLSHLKDV